ncbi:unnamed protein product [Penicillium glandicola]
MASYCGCLWTETGNWQPQYLPQVSLKAHATILSSAARTTLTQTFVNPSHKAIREVFYHFPLYDGVSVVGFECKVGSRHLHSKVKTKSQANTDYQNAVVQQQTDAVMDHTSMNDIFVIRLGNVPSHGKINVDITFVGELKQDSQTDGIRYTLPSSIAPRYGTHTSYTPTKLSALAVPAELQGMSITVDIQMEKGLVLRELESPSHRIKVSLGRISSTPASSSIFEPSHASATVIPRQNDTSVVLEQDFVVLIKADGLDIPCALLETHPTIPNQRALMATLVPKFSLRPASPEVVFIIDRSGSMGDKIQTLKSALGVFLKSLPSKVYDASSLNEALAFAGTISANMGDTEMRQAVVATVENRLNSKDLDVLILADGQIYQQDYLFEFVREKAADNTTRFFSLGIGKHASHSLIEGITRAGNGFCQWVTEYEELDRKVVRMLKGALTPHVSDYKLEVEYDTEVEQEFEVVSDTEHLTDSETEEPDMDVGAEERATEQLPTLTPPGAIQAPYQIPALYPFIRTNVFLLMDPHSSEKIPKSLKLSATSQDGPLQLRIPICDIRTGETIHQLASRKAVIEVEEGHGWLSHAKDEKGNKFNQFHKVTKQRLAERECQNLGIKFQFTGKYCSFVALEETSSHAKDEKGNKFNQFHKVTKQRLAERECQNLGIKFQFTGKYCSFVALEETSSSPAEKHTQKEHAVEHISRIHTSPTLHSPIMAVRFSDAPRACTGGGGLRGGRAPEEPTRGHSSPVSAYDYARGQNVSHQAAPIAAPTGSACLNSFRESTLSPVQAPRRGELRELSAVVTRPQDSAAVSNAKPVGMYDLIHLQTFEGSWMWSKKLFELMGCDLNAVLSKLVALCRSFNQKIEYGFPNGSEVTVLATLLAMAWLAKKHSDSRTVWELLDAKASEWVNLELKKMKDQGLLGAIMASIRDKIVDII